MLRILREQFAAASVKAVLSEPLSDGGASAVRAKPRITPRPPRPDPAVFYLHNLPLGDGRDEVVTLLREMVVELEQGGTWVNRSVPAYLEQLADLLPAIDRHHMSYDRPLPRTAWDLLADALRNARYAGSGLNARHEST